MTAGRTLSLLRLALAAVVLPPVVAVAAPAAPAGSGVLAGTGAAPVTHVVAVSVDGLNPRALRRLGPARTPTFHRLLAEGAATLNARTAVEATKTLPNHTTMLTGRRVRRSGGGHGISMNSDPQTTIHRRAGGYVSSVFDVVHDHGGSTALYAGKPKFGLYTRTWRRHGAGGSKLDTYVHHPRPGRLTRALVRQLADDPATFSFLHLATPDTAGHAHGFMGTRYLAAVARADAQLGLVLDAIERSPRLRGRTVLLVTADHGGKRGHADPSRLANYRIPFFAWGPGVSPGRGLYAINEHFRSPRRERVGYRRARQPVRNGLIANLSTGLLGLPAVPGSTIDPLQQLTVTD